jgi:hypothetical protein
MNINSNMGNGMNMPSTYGYNQIQNPYGQPSSKGEFFEQAHAQLEMLQSKSNQLLQQYNQAKTSHLKTHIQVQYASLQLDMYDLITNASPKLKQSLIEHNEAWKESNQMLDMEISDTGSEALKDTYDSKLIAYSELKKEKTSLLHTMGMHEPESPIGQQLQEKLAYVEETLEAIQLSLDPDQLRMIDRAKAEGSVGFISAIKLHDDYDGGANSLTQEALKGAIEIHQAYGDVLPNQATQNYETSTPPQY